MLKTYLLHVAFFTLPLLSNAQADSTLQNLENLPAKYFTQLDSKIDKYSSRITKKTTKTLEKLARWETKIKSLLDKTSPEIAAQLFGEGKMTFNKLLQQMESGQQSVLQYQTFYDKYRDDLTTSLKYVEQQKEYVNEKVLAKAKQAKEKMQELNAVSDSTEAIQQFIKERKKELINTAFQYLGKNKYLSKINKEAWYYAETMKNYKEIFSDEKKMEQTAKMILNKIPFFKKFAESNSQLAGLFPSLGGVGSSGASGSSSIPIVNGLPPRTAVQSFIQSSIPALNANTNPIAQLQLPDVKEQLNKWRDVINKHGDLGEDPVGFKPNMQRLQPFWKRIEYGTDLQFRSSNTYLPSSANMAIKIGYRLNDKSSIGGGINYVLGLGEGWDKIHFSTKGFGYKTYIKWKLKKGFDLQGGAEWDKLQFNDITAGAETTWKQSALLGISKNYTVSKKLKGNIQVMYDFLYRSKIPITQPVVFRFGYTLK